MLSRHRIVYRLASLGLAALIVCAPHRVAEASVPPEYLPLFPGIPAFPSPPNGDAHTDDSAEAYYAAEVDPGIQRSCLTCHRAGGAAPQSGARLVLGNSAADNHRAFESLLVYDDVDGAWILAKVTGQAGHGGGAILTEGAPLYLALQQYLKLMGQGDADIVDSWEPSAFWDGTAAEQSEVTLRRASLLFSAQVPDAASIELASKSEEGLRQQILASMSGRAFHDFILRGANDRLLVEGLLNGINFDISTYDRYPKLAELLISLPEDRPEEFEDFHEKPFLTRWDADWSFRWAITREPLELIAHVIMNDLSYQKVLTADHTMVNAFSDLAYRSEAGFDHQFADQQGFYDRSQFNIFRPGYNDGHIPHDERFEASEEQGVVSFSDYQEWPHAGVLSTQAWLARYPSTDTNRNRARARWTYFHFLGVDIEKSAPRTTDPVALADTNNPTMNNSACTVCHERLDPLAGAYQSFGDLGHYLDQFGGKDSLADSYKCPECYGGEWGSTLYREGDTWYRDMRTPGFEGARATGIQDSVQWLAQQIVQDPRFAAATVRFWWPAIFGSDPLIRPENPDSADYQASLTAYHEQERLIDALAAKFEASGFNAKSLFADMVMSPWYRNSEVTDPALVEARGIELATVGRGRLLGPEELDRKNRALFGRTWQQWHNGVDAHSFSQETALTGFRARFKGFYGGIDGASVTVRSRDMTALMSNLTESMASDLACQVVLEDFNRPDDERFLFEGLRRNDVPGQLLNLEKPLSGKIFDMGSLKSHLVEGTITAVGGQVRVRIDDTTTDPHKSLDSQWTGAELVVKEVLFKKGGTTAARIRGTDLSKAKDFQADQWTDEDGRKHWRGQVEDSVGWRMHPQAWVAFSLDLNPGDYQVEVRLGTALLSNNANDAMGSRVKVTALESIADTDSGRQFSDRISALLTRAIHRSPTEAEVSGMLDTLVLAAEDAYQRGNWFMDQESRCDTWTIWPGEELTHEENRVRYGDPEGMMRGWTTLLHGVMTSYGYLHD